VVPDSEPSFCQYLYNVGIHCRQLPCLHACCRPPKKTHRGRRRTPRIRHKLTPGASSTADQPVTDGAGHPVLAPHHSPNICCPVPVLRARGRHHYSSQQTPRGVCWDNLVKVPSIQLGSPSIPFSDKVRDLGFYLDSELSMKHHIKMTSNSLHRNQTD